MGVLKRRFILFLFMIGLLRCLIPGNGYARLYQVAILPNYFPIVVLERFQPLINYLEDATGEEYKIIIPKSFAHHIQLVQSGKVDFSYQDPYVYTKVCRQVKPLAVASNGRDGANLRGIVIVKRDSNINNPTNLEGKTGSIVAYTSAGGWLSQIQYLKNKGIDAERELKVTAAPGNKQEEVVRAVSDGRVDFGFVNDISLGRLLKTLTVLRYGQLLPNWTFATSKGLSKSKIAAEVQVALFALTKDHAALKKAGIDKFVRPKGTKLEAFRRKMTQ